MKVKILAILGTPFPGKKDPASGIVKVCAQYSESVGGQTAGNHLIYFKQMTAAMSLKVADVVDVTLKLEEMCFPVTA